MALIQDTNPKKQKKGPTDEGNRDQDLFGLNELAFYGQLILRNIVLWVWSNKSILNVVQLSAAKLKNNFL